MTSKTVDALDVSSSTASTATRTYEWDALDVFLSYSALALALAFGDGRALSGWQFGYVPYFAALASLSIYIGAHRGLTRDFRETISFESSLAGPFVLSGALFAAYVCLEVFKLDLSVVTNAYFFILSAFAVAGNAVEPLHASGEWWRESAVKIAVPNGWATDPKTGEVVEDAELDVTPAQMVGAVAGLALATADLQAGHQSFTLNNAVACFIVSDFLSVIGFGSFKSCATALVGLLAYDAFWVFKSESVVGQNVMMSVATNQSFNGPFRLLFPRFEDVLNPLPIDTFPFSLLGLGDIAIPGMLCALMLRYDASRATDLRGRANAAASAFMDVFDTEREEVAKNVSNGSVDADDVDVEIDGYRTGIGRRAGDAAVLAYDEANGGVRRRHLHSIVPGRTSLLCDVHPSVFNRSPRRRVRQRRHARGTTGTRVPRPHHPRRRVKHGANARRARSLLLLHRRARIVHLVVHCRICLLYTSPSPRDKRQSRMPSSA